LFDQQTDVKAVVGEIDFIKQMHWWLTEPSTN